MNNVKTKMVATDADNVSVKLDGKYVLFREVKITINETAAFPSSPLDIQLTLANGEIIYDNGCRVEVIVRA